MGVSLADSFGGVLDSILLTASIETQTGAVFWANAHTFISDQGVGLVATRALSPSPAQYNWFVSSAEQAAFRLEGTTIPEPASLVLTGIGMAALALERAVVTPFGESRVENCRCASRHRVSIASGFDDAKRV